MKKLSYEDLQKRILNPDELDLCLLALVKKGAIIERLHGDNKIRYQYNPKYKMPCIYAACCRRYPDCPFGHGDYTRDYSCLAFVGEPNDAKDT